MAAPWIVTAFVALSPATADAAQPIGGSVDASTDDGIDTTTDDTSIPEPDPQPVYQETQPQPVVETTTEAPKTEDGAKRPIGKKTFGIGAGVAFPGEPFGLWNTASVRFRFPKGHEVEPFASVNFGGSSDVNEAGMTTTTNKTSDIGVGVGAQYRHNIANAGNVDMFFIANGNIGLNRAQTNPDGADNNTTVNTTTAGLGWGVGLEWFLHRHVSVSADGTNPLLVLSRSKTTNEVAGGSNPTQTSTTYNIEATWAPQIRSMLHLWF